MGSAPTKEGSNSPSSKKQKKKNLLESTKVIDVIPEKQKMLRIDSRLLLPKTFQVFFFQKI